jgi:ribosomal protein L17
VSENHAYFEIDLEKTMREEIGRDLFDALLKEEKIRCGIAKDKHALKNPTVICAIVARAAAQEKRSATIESIVDAIVERAKATAVLSAMPRIA